MNKCVETDREMLERRYFALSFPSIFFGWNKEQSKRREQTVVEFRRTSKAIRKRKSYVAFAGLFEKHPKVPLHVWKDCLEVVDKARLFAYQTRATWVLESAVVAYEDRKLKKINDAKLRRVVFALEV